MTGIHKTGRDARRHPVRWQRQTTHGPSARSLSACTPRVTTVMQINFLSLPSILMPQLMRPLRNARPEQIYPLYI